MILNNDDIYSHLKMVYNECDQLDKNHYGFLSPQDFENALYQSLDGRLPKEDIEVIKKLTFERFFRKNQSSDDCIMYGDKDDNGMPLLIDNIIRHRAEIITQGLIENDRNKLESYLMTYFAEADSDKTGFLTETQLLKALHKCPRMTLIDLEVASFPDTVPDHQPAGA